MRQYRDREQGRATQCCRPGSLQRSGRPRKYVFTCDECGITGRGVNRYNSGTSWTKMMDDTFGITMIGFAGPWQKMDEGDEIFSGWK